MMGAKLSKTYLPFRKEAVAAFCDQRKAAQFFGSFMKAVDLSGGIAGHGRVGKKTRSSRPTEIDRHRSDKEPAAVTGPPIRSVAHQQMILHKIQ